MAEDVPAGKDVNRLAQQMIVTGVPAADPATAADPSSDGKAATAPSGQPGFVLGPRLEAVGRHPVLLFGTTSSGKSSILMSFIANLMQNHEVDISLGEPIFPAGNPRRKDAHDFAVEFFERRAQEFVHSHQMLAATMFGYPIFVPIDVQRSRDVLPVKFAFLEGKGEWYEPRSQTSGTIFQELKSEVADVLKYYDGSLSAIFVAPCSDLDDEVRLRQNDIGLLGALNAYRELRSRQEIDSLLFLLTKWDVHADPIRDPRFGRLSGEDVAKVLERQYPDSWRAFQSMPRSLANDRRFFMQYCAGYLVEGANRAPPGGQKDAFDRYPRTLLNWLYGNATRTTLSGGRKTRERVLFDDVVSKDELQVRFLERVTNFIFTR